MLSPELLQRVKTRARDPYLASDANQSEHATPPFRRIAHPPVTPEQIVEAERLLGFALAETLKQLYLEVGDGGFGPGYGLDRLLFEPWPNSAGSVVHGHRQWDKSYWPEHLLAFCDWGCSILSFLDLQTGRVGIVDLSCSPEEPYNHALEWTSNSLEEWMESWVNGENTGFNYPDL